MLLAASLANSTNESAAKLGSIGLSYATSRPDSLPVVAVNWAAPNALPSFRVPYYIWPSRLLAARFRKCYDVDRSHSPLQFGMPRTASIDRKTAETDIQLTLNVDGSGRADIATGVGFLDHMLTLLAKHAAVDLTVRAKGDLEVDQHHTVEDTGICLGQALKQAIGDKAGIRRYGHFTLPMDETLATVALDLGGRFALAITADFPSAKIGDFDTKLVEEFWRAFAANALCNLHILVHYGRNSHHISEAIFKATARALRMATETDSRMTGVPSTKGSLDG